MSLFKLYDFSFIPVELISSIYQEFLGAEALAEVSSVRKNQPRNQEQRKLGAYYTPPRLAELTVDIATEDWDTLLNKRCLDPACGSGIFLVILFVRMAEEWRNRHPNATTEHRYEEMKRLLAENLCGVDINLTACLVTCFSLYLAFLDQMEPKEITELRVALEQDLRAKLLPRILWEKDKPRPRIASIRELDFFEMNARREYDLVIGNPPWVSRKDAPSAEVWLFSEVNPAAKGLKKSEREQILFPSREWACAFMWKAGLHARDTGRVCQILPSRVFLSNNTDSFQAAWLKAHRLEAVWLLADYSFILFPGADCPCFIGRYHPRRDGEKPDEFEYVTPKVERMDPRDALLPVQPEDQKTLNECDIIAAAERNDAARTWKQYHWGTPRDLRLIERLMRYPKLDSLCARPPDMKRDTPNTRNAVNQKRWWRGQGFQPLTAGRLPLETERAPRRPWPIWWDKNHKFLSADAAPTGIAFLVNDECQPYGSRPDHVRRTIAPELCRAPMLLINQACTKFLFSDFNVLFQHDFQSICANREDENELLFLMAVLSSPLTQYLLFHITANIGIKRDIARLEELLQLPFPLPHQMADRERSQRIVHECAGLLRSMKQEALDSQNLLRVLRFLQDAWISTEDERRGVSRFEGAMARWGAGRILDKGLDPPSVVNVNTRFCLQEGYWHGYDLALQVKDENTVSLRQEAMWRWNDGRYSEKPYEYYNVNLATKQSVVSIYRDNEGGEASTKRPSSGKFGTRLQKIEDLPANDLAVHSLQKWLEENSNIPAKETPFFEGKRWIEDFVQEWAFYDTTQMNIDAIRRANPEIGSGDRTLTPSGINLALVLFNLTRDSIDFEEKLREGMSELFPATRSLRANILGRVSLTVEWHLHGVPKPFFLDEMSEGTVRMLCWMAILFSPKIPTLLILDEPEASLHPAWLRVLAGWIRDAARRTQIIVSTHSPDLLDYFTEERNSVRVFNKDPQNPLYTRIERIDKEATDEKIAEGWQLGDLYRVGDPQIGGWPW